MFLISLKNPNGSSIVRFFSFTILLVRSQQCCVHKKRCTSLVSVIKKNEDTTTSDSNFVFVNKAGELLYCKSEKMTTCCFYKHTCVKSGFEREDMAVVELKSFIKNQVIFFTNDNE